jgi:hypothetical protein
MSPEARRIIAEVLAKRDKTEPPKPEPPKPKLVVREGEVVAQWRPPGWVTINERIAELQWYQRQADKADLARRKASDILNLWGPYDDDE